MKFKLFMRNKKLTCKGRGCNATEGLKDYLIMHWGPGDVHGNYYRDYESRIILCHDCASKARLHPWVDKVTKISDLAEGNKRSQHGRQ